jgi:hypothetical protein
MDVNNEIIQLLLKNSSAGMIREAAVRNGMQSLSDDGWRLVRLGVTTPEEVMRVTKDQTMFGDGKKLTVDKPVIDVVSEAEVKPKMAVVKH